MTAWTVRLSARAEEDFRGIVRWTAKRFGSRQARIYADILSDALIALTAGPSAIGVRAREDIGPSLQTFHVARGRHFIMFRVGGDERPTIEVIRLLHEAMDLPRHLPPAG